MLTKMQSGEDFAIQTKGGGKIVVPNVVTEPQFNPSAAYVVDAKVWYGAVQYICTTATMEPVEGQANPTPEEDSVHWAVLPIEEMAKKSESVQATRTVNGKVLSSDVTLTGADIAVSGTDATKISDALAGKLSTSGGEVTGQITVKHPDIPPTRIDNQGFKVTQSRSGNGTSATVYGLGVIRNDKNNLILPETAGTLALAAPNPTAGNLAALDSDGNPTDSGLSKDEVADLLSDAVRRELDGTTNPTKSAVTIGSRVAPIGKDSLAQGNLNKASNSYSHAQGQSTQATGQSSHAEGVGTQATAQGSHAEGFNTKADFEYSHAEGKFNAPHIATMGTQAERDAGTSLHTVGFGTSDNDRRNAVETMQDGKTYIYGLGNYNGTNPTNANDLASAVNAKVSVDNTPADVNIVHISQDDYEQLVFDGNALSNTLYVVSSEYINAYGETIQNVVMTDDPEESEAATQHYVDAIGHSISTELTSLAESLSSILTGQIEDKSSVWLSSAVAGQPLSGGALDKLNIIKFDSLATYELCSSILTLSDLALIDEDQINAENERIISVADPVDGTDAANKQYVDGMLSSISTNSVLTSFFNSVEMGGINAVTLEHTVSAVYELIKALR